MKKIFKVLLSIPSILVISYMLVFFFPEKSKWLVPNMEAYNFQITILKILTIIQVGILILKLWSFKQLEKSRKRDWTWILILFNSISALIFIWKKVDKFAISNNNLAGQD